MGGKVKGRDHFLQHEASRLRDQIREASTTTEYFLEGFDTFQQS
jgi:hypothetical protein